MVRSHDEVMVSVKGALSLQDMIHILVDHGCPDVTSKLDDSRFSEYPIHGGGFGDIYSGEMKDGMKVAVKCARYRHQEEGDRQNMKLAARELFAWSKCQHPNVLTLVGLAQHRGQLAMVSPWMENQTLPEYITRHPYVNRVNLCLQVTRGLVYLHHFKMFHGDLKGANVLISDAGIAKLTDFGSTKLKEQTLRFTTETSVPYSLRWAAPEILNGSPHNAQSDIYSLGMTILETLTGKVPYEDKPEMSVLVEVVINKHPPPRKDELIQIQENKDSLWELMAKCWSYDPPSRPQAAEVQTKLTMILAEPAKSRQEGVSIVPGTSPTFPPFYSIIEPPDVIRLSEDSIPTHAWQVGWKPGQELLVHFTQAFLLIANNDPEWKKILGNENKMVFRMVGDNEAQLIVDANQQGEAIFEIRHSLATTNGLTTLPYTVPAGAADILPVICSAARWSWYMELTNPEQPFASSVDMQFTRLRPARSEGFPLEPIGQNLNDSGVVDITLNDGDMFGVKLFNSSLLDLYAYLFYFDASGQAIQPYYLGAREGWEQGETPLQAKSTIGIGYGSPGHPFLFQLLGKQDLDVGIVKLFITTSPTDFSVLEQSSPFEGTGVNFQQADLTNKLNLPGFWDTITMTIVQRRAPAPRPVVEFSPSWGQEWD